MRDYTVCYLCAVEVGSLHTLMLESLKLVFQPLHKFLVNYSFGKSVRTSTLCMTHGIFPNFFYRQIISLYLTVSNPVGQKFTYTKLTAPLNSLEIPENYVMALEASDRLIDII